MKRWLVRIAVVLVMLGAAGLGIYKFMTYAELRLDAAIRSGLKLQTKSITHQMQRIAAEQTARFVLEDMPKVPTFSSRFKLLDHSLKMINPKQPGLYCEFGVFSGSTINHIAAQTDRTIHGFDSFEGLPETWRTDFYKGAFNMEGLPEVRKNVALYKGWFNESLPVWAKEHPGPIIFMHLDADLYSSTKTVFDILGDRLVPGSVLQFDEYFNYPGWQGGEFRAFREFVMLHDVDFEYIGYCDDDEQVSIRIRNVGSPDKN